MRNPRISTAILSLTVGGFLFSGLLLFLLLGVVWAASPEVLMVTNTNDAGPGSLRQAMQEALPQDEIRFDPGLSEQTITLTSGEIRLDRAVTIDAGDAPTLTVSAGDNSRVFFVNGSGVTVRNLILADGNGSGATYPSANGYGGCIYVTTSTAFNLEDVELRDCRAQYGGGAIANFYSKLDCTDCYLHDSEVLYEFGFGGAIYNYASFGLASTVTISGSVVLSNTAASGGAFMNDGSGDPAYMTVRNSFVGQNQATASGGAFFNLARQQSQRAPAMGRRRPEPDPLPSADPFSFSKTASNSTAFVRDARLDLDRTFVAGNEAAVSCGGICNVGEFNSVNTMISANKAMTGGAIVNGDQLNIDWTTLAYNEADFGNAIAYSDVFELGAKIAVNDSLLWNPESGPVAQGMQQETDNECFADEGVGTTPLTGSGNIFSTAACAEQVAGQVKDPKLVPINNNVYILGEGNELSDASAEERPGGKDIVEVPSEPPQAPGAQGHEHILTVTKETLPPSDASFAFAAIHYLGRTDDEALRGYEVRHLADGGSFSLPILHIATIAETGASDDDDSNLYSVEIICDPPIAITVSDQVTLDTKELPFGDIACTFRNILHGSITVKKMIPGGVEPPDESFSFTLATNARQLAGFGLGPGEGETFNKLVPNEYFVSEASIPDGWVLEDVTCDAIDYRRTNDTTAPGVAINLQLGEDVTCEFQNEWLSGTQTPTPTASPTTTPTPTATATPQEPGTDPEGPDYFPIGIEVNQAIQNMENDVVLIADKATTVRVYVNGDGWAPFVDGVLHGTRGGAALPGSPLSVHYKVPVLPEGISNRDRNLERITSLDFDLPPSWLHAGIVELTAEINPNHRPQERTFENNMISVKRPLHQMPPIVMNWISVKQKGTRQVSTTGDFNDAYRFMRDTYPVSQIVVQNKGSVQVGPLNSVDRQIALLNQLQEMDEKTDEAEERAVWVGLVHPDIDTSAEEGDVLGRAWYDSQQAFAKPDEYTLAHEIGHAYNRQHVNCPAGDPMDTDLNYPYPNCKISQGGSLDHWGLRVRLANRIRTKDPNNHPDFMTYGAVPWVSDYTYEALWEYLLTNSGEAARQSAMAAQNQTDTVLRVIGVIDSSSVTASIERIYTVTDGTSIEVGGGGDYLLELIDGEDMVLSSRHFSPEVFSEAELTDLLSFSVLTPRLANTATVRVSREGTVLTERTVSANPPVVTVISPNGGETVDGPIHITWSASDTDDDALSYTIQYSTDNGAAWQAVAVQLTETTFELDTVTLPGGQQSLIRIIANDGYHSASDESDQAFTVARKGPRAMIIDPQDQQAVLPGVSIYLYGYGYDPEDGPLDDEAFKWSSDTDGDLGVGADVITALSPGPHIITLTVTDSDGNQTIDSVELVGGIPLYLPSILAD